MNINFTARNCSPPESVRERARKRLAGLRRYEPGLARADVIFEIEHGLSRVEARMFVTGGQPIIAEASGSTFRQALDRLVGRLGRQLKRRRERRRDHQAVKLAEFVSATAENP